MGGRDRFDLTVDARLLLAAVSAGAGAIHLAMVPSHWGESVAEGLGFAAAGWLQLVFAAVVLTRPTRALLRLGIVVNLAAIAAWIVSRTAGLPFGAHSGHAESAGFVDVTCVVLEAVLVVACAVLVVRPRLTARFARSGLPLAATAGIAVLALSTAALASPGARDHAAHSHGDATGDAHAHGTDSGGGTAAGAGHDHAVPSGADDKDLGLAMLHSNGHHEAMKYTELSAADQAGVDRLLALSRTVTKKYPTLDAAIKAGFLRGGPFQPGLGIHYRRPVMTEGLNPDGVMDDYDMLHPFNLIFDGVEPTSKIAGFMYYSAVAKQPEGLPGSNDFWHFHTNYCYKPAPDGNDAPLGMDFPATQAACTKAGGMLIPQTQWMVHVWSVPGYEVSKADGGVFAEMNPNLKCSDGTYFMMNAKHWPSHPKNLCKSAL